MNLLAKKEVELLDYHPKKSDMKSDVLQGLQNPEKWISSMYFYDEHGSKLFDDICELPEYYPTRTELAIMQENIDDICSALGPQVSLIELGSGSSLKIRELLDHLDDPAVYVPVEISREHLIESAEALQDDYPDLEILPVCADFTGPFDLPSPRTEPLRNIVYFPGSTIGNFEPDDALSLLIQCTKIAKQGGGMLIGVDLQKDRETLERAYNDAAGVTAEFNLNVLTRLNRELQSNFNLENFRHRAIYNTDKYRIEMHLVSTAEQTVTIDDNAIHFKSGESIHTENSYKYTLEGFRSLAKKAGFEVKKVWTDEKNLFSVQYLTTVS